MLAMFVVCVEFEIMPQHLDNFLLLIRKNAAQSHELEAGCWQFDVCQDQKNPNNIRRPQRQHFGATRGSPRHSKCLAHFLFEDYSNFGHQQRKYSEKYGA